MIPSFDPLAFLFVCGIIFAVLGTVLAVILKLAGVLIVSWWWIALPLPALVVVCLVVLGVLRLLDGV